MNSPDIILALDWAKSPKGRAAFLADVEQVTVKPVVESEWSLETILKTARQYQDGCRRILVSMDLAFGVPSGYWGDIKRVGRWSSARHFVDWLELIGQDTTVWQEVRRAADWHVEQPFFSIPAGKGTRSAYDEQAGYSMLRAIDRSSQAKPTFCVSGIPGTVGSGTRSLWQELAPLLESQRDFLIWPFEGCLDELFACPGIVLAEGYPGIAYTAALALDLPARMRRIAKTKADQRAKALEELANAVWVCNHKVKLEGIEDALASEDNFDALLSAAGLLRCVLERRPLEAPEADPIAEGGILLAPVIDFSPKTQASSSKRQRLPGAGNESPGLVHEVTPVRTKRGRNDVDVGYDIIGDIHGHADALERLLHKLGYEYSNGYYCQPGRRVIFLGDFIDRGPQVCETLEIVYPMVNEGAALAVMGNHEFNAIAFHMDHPTTSAAYLRERSYKNIRQFRETIGQLSDGELERYIDWFKHLDLWLDLGDLRVVHACWDPPSIALVDRRRHEYGGINDQFFHAACERDDALFEAVEILLKGKEIDLPRGVTFLDKDKHERTQVRVKWYLPASGLSYRDYAFSFRKSEQSRIPDIALPESVAKSSQPYPPTAPPVFVGHYWMPENLVPTPLVSNVACLDYSVAKGGTLCAYRWTGERQLEPNFISVPARTQ